MSRLREFLKRLKTHGLTVVALGIMLALGVYSFGGMLVNGGRSVLSRVQNDPAPKVCSTQNEDVADQPEHYAALNTPQQRDLRAVPSLSTNLVHNADLRTINGSVPAGFYPLQEAEGTEYSYDANQKFLRVVSRQDPNPQTPAAGWIMDKISIASGQTYRYSFAYRSSVPVTVGIESHKTNGRVIYSTAATLPRQDHWREFTSYISDTQDVSAFRFVVTPRVAGSLETKAYQLHRVAAAQLAEGLVTIAFDDGWQSVADHALPLLKSRDIRTTQYAVSHMTADGTEGYMNARTLRSMRGMGHEIGSHSVGHCSQTSLPTKEMAHDIITSRQTLRDLGLGSVTSFAYPYGQHNDQTLTQARQHYTYLRTSDPGFNDRYFDTGNIRSYAVLSDTPESQIRTWLDHAKRNRMWVVLVYHRVNETGDYSVTRSQLARQLDLVKASKLKVLPLSEAADSVRSQR